MERKSYNANGKTIQQTYIVRQSSKKIYKQKKSIQQQQKEKNDETTFDKKKLLWPPYRWVCLQAYFEFALELPAFRSVFFVAMTTDIHAAVGGTGCYGSAVYKINNYLLTHVACKMR